MALHERQLRYFLTIAEVGSLGKAAQMLHIAQPALSRQLRLLEEDVGAQLMQRHARGVSLTAAGQSYYESVTQLLRDSDAAAVRAQQVSNGTVGHIRFGVSETAAWNSELLAAISEFRKECAGVSFAVEAALSGVVTEHVINGRLDLAVAYNGPLLDSAALSIAPWTEDVYHVAVHEASPLAGRAHVTLNDLRNESFVSFERQLAPQLYDGLTRHLVDRGVNLSVVQHGTSLMTVLILVACGVGCAFVPGSTRQHLPTNVRLLPVTDLGLQVPIGVVWRKDNLSPLIPRFLKLFGVKPPQ